MAIKVGYIFDNFSYAADLIDGQTYRWVIVERFVQERGRIFWNIILPAADSHYLRRLGWQNFPLRGSPGKSCYYHNPNRTFEDIISAFRELSEIDFKVELTLGLESRQTVVPSTLNNGVLLVFLQSPSGTEGRKHYTLFTRSPTMIQVFKSIYSQGATPWIEGSSFNIGPRNFKDVKQEILAAIQGKQISNPMLW